MRSFLTVLSLTTAAGVAPTIPLGGTPAVVARVCVERAQLRKFPVFCPTRYPHVRATETSTTGAVLRGPSFYWASFNDFAGFPTGDGGHLILGGQRHPFSLVGKPGQTWPRPGQPRPVAQLPLPRLITTPMQGGKTFVAQRPARILRHIQIGGRPALVLLASSYPLGGISGGHVIALWNERGHGYLISLHFATTPSGASYPLASRVAAALAIGGSSALVPPR
jgi:hypothetical protein